MCPVSCSTHRRLPVPGRTIVTLLIVSILALVGCAGSATGDSPDNAIPAGYPTIASPDFHGTFEIGDVTVDGSTVDPAPGSTPLVDLDVVTGAVTLDLGCVRRLGSFTLAADGTASITLTGQIEVDPCPPQDPDDPLLDLLGRVERWEPAGDGFRLVAAGGDHLVLVRI